MKNTRVLIRAKGRGLCIERGLNDCLQRELFADVTLNCDGGKIRANKGVLAAASPVLCHLLKDWPVTEDACVIMAGYTEEEVQGLVRYIYTGQLSTPPNHSCSWEKIIEDFKVGLPPDIDEDEQSIVDNLHISEHSSLEAESNGPPIEQKVSLPIKPPLKQVGPKIVAVTSPRPLIVQVQSLNQSHANVSDVEGIQEVNDIPYDPFVEMTIDEGPEHYEGELSITSQVKRKRTGKAAVKKIKKKRPAETLINPVLEEQKVDKKLAKRVKPVSKFARKKYCCPHCNRRFLTRGNVKNHMRIHSRDKPFQCPICQDLFAYQGVYQRHLLRHKENNEISEEDLSPILAESLRRAEEITKQERTAVRILEGTDGEPDISENADPEGEEEIVEEEEEEEEEAEAEAEVEEDEEDDDEAALDEGVGDGGGGEEEEEIEEQEEEKIVQSDEKSKDKLNSPSSSQTDVGVHFLCADPKEESFSLTESRAELSTPSNKGRTVRKKVMKGKKTSKDKNDKPKHRMNYQIIECDYCPMKYHKWSAFYVHRCTHTGETPVLPCGVCDLEFPNIKALKEHKTSAHPSAVFQCDQCERSFLSRSALLMHQPVHSTKLNFQCRYCQAKMRTLKERYVHERIHTADETPFSCSQCDKQFNTLVNLRSHLKLHANDPENNPT